MKKTLMDSGPMIALFDVRDPYHKPSLDFIQNNTHELITTLVSITEVVHLLGFHNEARLDFLTWIHAGAVTVHAIKADDLQAIHELLLKYADLPMDFADACLVHLGEKLKIDTVATIDRDFDVYRLSGKRPFTTFIK